MKKWLLILVMIVLVSCGTESGERENEVEKVEAYTVEAFDDEPGHYTKVNSQIVIYGPEDDRKVEAKLIEDFYDENWNFIKSHVTHSKVEFEEDQVKTLDEPQTILLPEEADFSLGEDSSELEGEDREKVNEHILKTINDHMN
ncbi:hypothetical protein [Aquisalibacillus elongatus]|uniref:Sporulation lipoprotein YhcN/YlaJ n=1 Tax=Aquisalibacillus elongatus TaxID=485577 RepID=A0A3N5C6G7_9BACI|nr:hypothetical protein [Aquisalibacillus elongatus]RPF53885.1 hypothetical protein EDC24_1068 [Aquisalibacillus elongatus]